MTKEELKQVVRVCGENYTEDQIPTIWRRKEKLNSFEKKGLLTKTEQDRLLLEEIERTKFFENQ